MSSWRRKAGWSRRNRSRAADAVHVHGAHFSASDVDGDGIIDARPGSPSVEKPRPFSYQFEIRAAPWRSCIGVGLELRRGVVRNACRRGNRSRQGRVNVLDGDDFEYHRDWLILRQTPFYGAKAWNYLTSPNCGGGSGGFRTAFRMSCGARARITSVSERPTSLSSRMVRPFPQARSVPGGDSCSLASWATRPMLGLEVSWSGLADHRQRAPDAYSTLSRNASGVQQSHGKSGVVVHGFVGRSGPLYRTAALTVAPLFAGGGTRLKILDSLAHATPVVSTHVGAFGIGALRGRAWTLCDSPDEFARCTAVLLDPESASSAKAGREFVQTRMIGA